MNFTELPHWTPITQKSEIYCTECENGVTENKIKIEKLHSFAQ